MDWQSRDILLFCFVFFFSLYSAVATWAIHNFRSRQAHTSTETIAWNKWFVLLSGINSVSVKAFQLPEKHLHLSSTRYWVIPGCQKWSQFFAYMSCNLQYCHQSNIVFMLQMRTQGSELLPDLFQLPQLDKCKAWTAIGENVPDRDAEDQTCTWPPVLIIPGVVIEKPSSFLSLSFKTLVKMISSLLS